MISKYKQKMLSKRPEVKLDRQVISETKVGGRIVSQQVVYTGNGTSITKHERLIKEVIT